MNTETPPEVAGDLPQDPNIIGAITPEEMALLTGLRQKSNQLVTEIGNLELQKARMIGHMANLEGQGNQVLASIAARFQLTPADRWHLLPDGRIQMIKLGLVPDPTE